MQGQAMAEYALCCVVLALALLARWGTEEPAVVLLAKALGGYVRNLTYLLSIS
jgi:Flp pilus assembly pilin Flp